AEPAMPVVPRPQSLPIAPPPASPQPQAISNISPPAISSPEAPVALPAPPRELAVPPAVNAPPSPGIALPPMQASLNLPDLPPVTLPDRHVEATSEATGIPRPMLPKALRQEVAVTSEAATANRPPAELLSPAPAKINAES